MNNLDRFFTPDATQFAQRYLSYVAKVISDIDPESIARFMATLLESRATGATVFFAGNGGSAATASHFANDVAIGTNSYERPFRVISLADNQAIVTALANDFSYEEIFARQLSVLGRPGDVLVAISASGNSPNLVRAIERAKAMGIKTVAITAFDGGKLKQMADDGIHVPTEPKEYGPAEDAHMILDHLVGSYLFRYVQHEALSSRT